jgi:MbtH protein
MSAGGTQTDRFLVLVNAEEQYSLWPETKDIPAGWRAAFTGSRAECLAHVERVWTDMRPASLRRAMDGKSRGPGQA